MSDNPTGLEFENIESANEQIAMLREDVVFYQRKTAQYARDIAELRADLFTAARHAEQDKQELGRVQSMLSERIKAHELDIAKTDWRVSVLLSMFKELDRRHDFTHAEIRGAIKLIEGYAALIATVRTLDDIPF